MYNIGRYFKYDSKREFGKIMKLHRLKTLTPWIENNNMPCKRAVDRSCVKPRSV